MQNVDYNVDPKKKVLTITIDLSKRFGASESGKTISVASTKGNLDIGFEKMKLGLNLFVPNPDFVKSGKGG